MGMRKKCVSFQFGWIFGGCFLLLPESNEFTLQNERIASDFVWIYFSSPSTSSLCYFLSHSPTRPLSLSPFTGRCVMLFNAQHQRRFVDRCLYTLLMYYRESWALSIVYKLNQQPYTELFAKMLSLYIVELRRFWGSFSQHFSSLVQFKVLTLVPWSVSKANKNEWMKWKIHGVWAIYDLHWKFPKFSQNTLQRI